MPSASRRALAAPDKTALADARAAWEARLRTELGFAVRVRFNHARSEPVRWSWIDVRAAQEIDLRLHERFASAPPEVCEALGRWMRSGKRARRACVLLDGWIAAEIETLPRRARRQSLRPNGRVHDLAPMAEELVTTLFLADFPGGDNAPWVTWGRRAKSRSRGSLRLGSFIPEDNLIRLHPVLDGVSVPEWFVRYVLFHELLHAALPPCRGSGQRWIHHGADFRRRERRYPDFARALTWERQNLARLVRRARRQRTEPAAEPAPLVTAAPRPTLIGRALTQGLLF